MSLLPTAATLTEKLPRFLRRHKLMTRWMQLTGEDPVQLVRIRDDSFGYADMSDGFLRMIVIDQHFEANFFAIADRIFRDGGVFLDGGANYGLLSFGLAGRHREAIDFHLFEPNGVLVRTIRRTAQRYADMRLALNEVAISDREGSIRFEVNEEQTGASHISDVGGIEVKCETIDGYLDRANLGHVDLLKLDVEGFELPAMRGAERALTERRIGALYFEYFEKWLIRVGPPRDVLAFLNTVKFETCFCRPEEFARYGSPTHVLEDSGVPLRPAGDLPLPEMTDLLAVPRERLVAL